MGNLPQRSDAGSTPPDPMATEAGGTGNPDDAVTIIDDGGDKAQDTLPGNDDGDTSSDSGDEQKAKDYPEPQSAKGAFVNDAGIDLNEEADHGPKAQGNRYPFNQDAAANYRDEADARIRDLERQIEDAKADREKWDNIANGNEPTSPDTVDSESDTRDEA